MSACKYSTRLACAAAVLGAASAAVAAPITIGTNTAGGADVNLVENNVVGAGGSGYSGNGTGPNLGPRFSSTDGATNHEVGLIRFNLAGIDPATITSARIEITQERVPSSTVNLRFFGVGQTLANQNFAEVGTTYATAPGLNEDANENTKDQDPANSDLGVLSFPTSPTGAEGNVLSFSSAALLSFLQSPTYQTRATDPGLVSFLIELDANSTGNRRFATKETTNFFSQPANSFAAGTAAPRLILEVPEPASLAAIGVGLVTFVGRRRRL